MSDQGHYSGGWSDWVLTDDQSRYYRMRLDENGSPEYEFNPPATGPTVPRGDNINDLSNAFSNVSINDSYPYQSYSEGQYGYSHGLDSGAGMGSANPYTAPPTQTSQHRLSSKEKSKASDPTAKSKKHTGSKASSSKKQSRLKGDEAPPADPFYRAEPGGATSADQVYAPSGDTLPREYTQRTDGYPYQESEGVDGGADERRAFSQFEPYGESSYDCEPYYTQEEPEQHPSRHSKGKHPKPSKGKQKQHTGYSDTATNPSEWTSTAGGSSSKYYDHASAEGPLEGAGDGGDQTPRAHSPVNPSQDSTYPPQDSYLPQEPHYSEEQYHSQDPYQYQSAYKTQHGPSTSQAATMSVYPGYPDDEIENTDPQDAITSSSQYPGQSQEVILGDVGFPFDGELDHRYTIEPSSRFAPGEVFKILWSEPKGGSTEVTEKREGHFMGKIFYFGFRRFIVVANDEGHCTCVPILTYERRACNKKGVKPQKHGIIYPSYGRAQPLPKEPELGFDPVRLELDSSTEKLAKESRVNYSKLVTVEHNVRVFFIGRIVAEDFDIVADAVDKCWADKRRGGKGGESSHHRRRHGR